MEFIANYWWVFLIIWIISLAYTISNQIERMKRMMNTENDDFSSFFKGIYGLAIGVIISSVSFVLFVVGSIIKIFAN